MEGENRKQKYLDKLKRMSSHELEKNSGDLIKSGFDHPDHRSNKQNQDTTYQANIVQDLESVISFIKPKERIINYKPDPKIKFGPPNATSTIKHHQIHSLRSKLSTTIKNNFVVYSNTLSSDQELKYKHMKIDEKAKLNLTYCLYMEFVHSQCDKIKSISEKVYPKNDYSMSLIKELYRITKKHQDNQDVDYSDYTHLTIHTCIDDQSRSTFNSDFIFKPVINLPNSPDTYSLKCFQDSSVISSVNNNDNVFDQSTSIYLTSFDSSSETTIQKLNTEEESNSKGSFKYYPRKMF